MTEVLLLVYLAAAPAASPELLKARDAQNLPHLEQIATQLSSAADRQPGDARAQYQAALAQSTSAEVATELHDKNRARGASEAGMKAAERAVALKSCRSRISPHLGHFLRPGSRRRRGARCSEIRPLRPG